MSHSKVITVAIAMLFAVSAPAQTTDPKKLKDQITGDAKAPASANPQCQLFTSAEIAIYAGGPVGVGENAAGGAGCNWHDKGYTASASVTVVPPNYFPVLDGVKGFKLLPGVGNKGWVAPDSGWTAGALAKDMGFVVGVSGKHATEAAAVALLQEAIKRHK